MAVAGWGAQALGSAPAADLRAEGALCRAQEAVLAMPPRITVGNQRPRDSGLRTALARMSPKSGACFYRTCPLLSVLTAKKLKTSLQSHTQLEWNPKI